MFNFFTTTDDKEGTISLDLGNIMKTILGCLTLGMITANVLEYTEGVKTGTALYVTIISTLVEFFSVSYFIFEFIQSENFNTTATKNEEERNKMINRNIAFLYTEGVNIRADVSDNICCIEELKRVIQTLQEDVEELKRITSSMPKE